MRVPTSQASDVPTVPEIGSDFELVEDSFVGETKTQRLPWERSTGITYVESGRQALAVVEAELRGRGYTHLHAPAYLCDSMISPFKSKGWTIEGLPVDADLVVRPEDLLARVSAGVLLHAPYFGRQDSPAMLEALEALRRRGVIVVVDESHRIFSGPSEVADIRVASVRKLLPVYDGGYVTNWTSAVRPRLQSSPAGCGTAVLRRTAMRAKSDALACGDDNHRQLALFAKTARATEIRTRPVHISQESLALLHRLDMGKIRSARQSNSRVLADRLGKSDRYRVINPPTADLLPSHLVLQTNAVLRLRQHLAGQRIFCPIHWPPSEILTSNTKWPDCYISLPIDHRYTESDMLRIAGAVKAFFATN